MTNVDISPEAVEAHRVRLLVEEGRTYTTDLIFALRAALTAAEDRMERLVVECEQDVMRAEAQRDAAAADMRERAAVEALRLEVPEDAGPIDGHARVMASVAIAHAIRALPLTVEKGGDDA